MQRTSRRRDAQRAPARTDRQHAQAPGGISPPTEVITEIEPAGIGDPATSGEPTRRSPKCPELTWDGAPGGIRTPDHLVRSQVLYPTELRAQRGHRTHAFYQVTAPAERRATAHRVSRAAAAPAHLPAARVDTGPDRPSVLDMPTVATPERPRTIASPCRAPTRGHPPPPYALAQLGRRPPCESRPAPGPGRAGCAHRPMDP